MQVVADEHEIALMVPMPVGPFSVVQLLPPLVVATTSSDPTAMQSVALPHEIAARAPDVGV